MLLYVEIMPNFLRPYELRPNWPKRIYIIGFSLDGAGDPPVQSLIIQKEEYF